MSIAEALTAFAERLNRVAPPGVSVWAEEQLKSPSMALFEETGTSMGKAVQAFPEAGLEGIGRPDLAVSVGGLLCGYIELKATGKGAIPSLFRDKADREQWERFKAIPNLIYFDGAELALYRDGLVVQGPIRLSAGDEQAFRDLTADFFNWEPIIPKSPAALAKTLAPLCRLLRDDVMDALAHPDPNPIKLLRKQWERTLLVSRTPDDFADEYAQTLTYALLLSRVEGGDVTSIENAADTLARHNELLAQVLRLLGQTDARNWLRVSVSLLQRAIGGVDPKALKGRPGRSTDPWLYFYEDFLQEYDAERRKKYGVYYTPAQLVSAQVAIIEDLLKLHLDRPQGFLDDVILLDPAVGTGSYPLAALTQSASKVVDEFGESVAAEKIVSALDRVYGFERFVGPYAIAHLRLAQLSSRYSGGSAVGLAHILLTDTLADPQASGGGTVELFALRLSQESAEANRIKRELPVLVCLGNPPYLRRAEEDLGGWVRRGRPERGEAGLIEDFIEPLREANRPGAANTLHELSVYFWRWAMWKVLEQSDAGGLISFVCPRALLAGPGHAGMRARMREEFDAIWILDLGGDNRGGNAADSQNVFAIETGVCVVTGLRRGAPSPQLAEANYTKLDGTRIEKLDALNRIHGLDDLEWSLCRSGRMDPLLPEQSERFASWPTIMQLMPMQVSGAQFKRTWPIGESREVLRARWAELLRLEGSDRRVAFVETRDRRVDSPLDTRRRSQQMTGIADLKVDAPCPRIIPYAYRAFDRSFALYDSRLGDYIRRQLEATAGSDQVFFATLMTKSLGPGPALSATAYMPDMDFFCNRGAADIIPMQLPDGAGVNLTPGLLATLSHYHPGISAIDVFNYVTAILGSPAYFERFSSDLSHPGPRIPITKNSELFRDVSVCGARLLWFLTSGERSQPTEEGQTLPNFDIRVQTPIPVDPDRYPESFSYDPSSLQLSVGEGVIEGVLPEVFAYEQSRWKVVPGWLGYRMKERAGRAGRSALDAIRPERWSFTEDLLILLRSVHGCVSMWPELTELLEAVDSSDCFSASELPHESVPEASMEGADEGEVLF